MATPSLTGSGLWADSYDVNYNGTVNCKVGVISKLVLKGQSVGGTHAYAVNFNGSVIVFGSSMAAPVSSYSSTGGSSSITRYVMRV